MKSSTLAFLLAGVALLASSGRLAANVIGFDDLPSETAIPTNYDGFTWGTDWYVISQSDYNGDYGNAVTFPSEANAAYNGFGVVDVSLSSGAAFDFNGAYFSGWAEGDEPVAYTAPSITVTGWNGATLVGTVTMSIPTNGFAWLSANLDDVTSLDFNNGGVDGQWWLMDNFTYNQSAVPDQGGALELLGAGMLLLVGYSRLRKSCVAQG